MTLAFISRITEGYIAHVYGTFVYTLKSKLNISLRPKCLNHWGWDLEMKKAENEENEGNYHRRNNEEKIKLCESHPRSNLHSIPTTACYSTFKFPSLSYSHSFSLVPIVLICILQESDVEGDNHYTCSYASWDFGSWFDLRVLKEEFRLLIT